MYTKQLKLIIIFILLLLLWDYVYFTHNTEQTLKRLRRDILILANSTRIIGEILQKNNKTLRLK